MVMMMFGSPSSSTASSLAILASLFCIILQLVQFDCSFYGNSFPQVEMFLPKSCAEPTMENELIIQKHVSCIIGHGVSSSDK